MLYLISFGSAADLGKNGTWCPKLYGKMGPRDSCVKITLRQLLGMSSGIISMDNSQFYNSSQWQKQYTFERRKDLGFDFSAIEALETGGSAWNITQSVKRVVGLPLEFVPGTKFIYSNPNYWVAQYIVEKVWHACALNQAADAQQSGTLLHALSTLCSVSLHCHVSCFMPHCSMMHLPSQAAANQLHVLDSQTV